VLKQWKLGGPEHILRYLAAYTHRIAISNRRLLALADGNITFRWRDSAHGNRKRIMSLSVDEFLRRSCSIYCRVGLCVSATSASLPTPSS
jgi:hypothetical protein